MCRSPWCSKHSVINRGAWTAEEDMILRQYVSTHGSRDWMSLPIKAGLKRCGRSCRVRWLNYLRPGIKRGNFSADEEELILRLHRLLGNRWSLIAGRLPGRTENEIKNHWIARLGKKKKNPPRKENLPKPNTASNLTPVKATPVRLSKHEDFSAKNRTIFKPLMELSSEELLTENKCGFINPAVENNSSPSMETVDKISSPCMAILVDSPLLAEDNLLYSYQLQSVESDILSYPYYSLEDFDFEGFLAIPGKNVEGQNERCTVTDGEGMEGMDDWVDELQYF